MKNFLKKLPLYSLLNSYRFWKWTEEDQKSLEFYQNFIKPGDLVYDVGANMGNRSKIFVKLQAKVIAFEPQKKCIEYLESFFKKERNFVLSKKALGIKEGEEIMFLSDATVLSTLSRQWLRAVDQSGRFNQYKWNETQSVQVTTLNKAIQEFGIPSFVKIDVEGYELEVLSGLSEPINCISIEFAAENIDNTFKCIDYINSLSSKIIFQISLGESMKFHLTSWVSIQEVKKILSDLVVEKELAWGDIYICDLSKCDL
jgi:hypothetical protein